MTQAGVGVRRYNQPLFFIFFRMKLLLIHAADPLTMDKVRKWRKKKAGLGEVYELSLVGDIESIRSDPEGHAYLDRQIARAQELYGVEEVVWL